MPSNHATTQGQAWDQIALERLGSEKMMSDLLHVNKNEMDTLLFAGGIAVVVPDKGSQTTLSLPPWERM